MFQVLLILPLYVVIFGFLYRFRRLINTMNEIDEMIFANCSLEEEIQEKGELSTGKREFLIAQVEQGKADKLPGKTPWTVKRLREATDQVIEKLHHEYHQTDVRHKAEKTGKAVSKHVVNLYSTGVSRFLKIDSIEQLRRDIDDDPIIKDSMAEVGALLVSAFGPWLSPLLIVAHTANRCQGLQPSSESLENSEGDEGNIND